MRRRARTDANHAEIVRALEAIGCSVFSTHRVGQGFPDLVVGRGGISYLLEVKDGTLPPSHRKLTKDEKRFAQSWRGHYAVVESVDDAIRAVTK